MTATMIPKKPKATKPETILKLVSRKNGATLKSLQEDASGWQPHSVRAALSRLRAKGHNIERSKDNNGVAVYRTKI